MGEAMVAREVAGEGVGEDWEEARAKVVTGRVGTGEAERGAERVEETGVVGGQGEVWEALGEVWGETAATVEGKERAGPAGARGARGAGAVVTAAMAAASVDSVV